MTAEKTVRFALAVCLLLSLLLYHAVELVQVSYVLDMAQANQVAAVPWLRLLKIVQIVVAGVFFVWLLYSPWVVKLFLGKRYIAGTYTGTSTHLREDDPGAHDQKEPRNRSASHSTAGRGMIEHFHAKSGETS